MRVLTLTNSVDAPFLTQQLSALERRGVSFTVEAVDGTVTSTTSRGPVDYLRYLPSVLRESLGEYDLVHAHYGLLGPVALAQLRRPVVLSLWGSDLYGPVEPISRLSAPLCDEVVVMSEQMRTDLGRECTVIPDGVNLSQFEPEPQDEARETVGWDAEAANVLFPYPPDREVKNYPRAERVVHAVDDLVDQPVRLQTISGVDHDDVSTYMSAADALILTSHSEGSPNSVKEAMACNLPVVAADVGDVRERLDGVDPSAVGSTDAELIDGLREVLERGERSNGREAAREVSVEHTAEAMLDVYERVA
ncbi:glycosyltransferase [Halobacteria archaeon AArc-dxtr1]|nr:glycosyltransferase [Halobacteria archaeon AArc-dxtr1]